MLRDLPPLKSLRVFEACMRLGSFSRAAKELNVGQPAISHQIHALERDLGTKLFERRGGRVVPTTNALTYCRVIAGALADMAQASVNLRRSARSPGLRLATYPGIAMFWLMPRLARLRKEHPSLTLRVTTVERDQDIPFEDIDCAILFGGGAWPGYESHRLIKEAVVMYQANRRVGTHETKTRGQVAGSIRSCSRHQARRSWASIGSRAARRIAASRISSANKARVGTRAAAGA